jgi:hypothetical protein
VIDIINNKTSFIELKHMLSKDSNQIMISGKFNVNYQADGLSVEGAEVLKHIALVVTRTANYQAVTPFQDVIVFDDDVTKTEEGCSGSFNFNVFDKIGFNGNGSFYIICSIGTVTSNIILAVIDAK